MLTCYLLDSNNDQRIKVSGQVVALTCHLASLTYAIFNGVRRKLEGADEVKTWL